MLENSPSKQRLVAPIFVRPGEAAAQCQDGVPLVLMHLRNSTV
jgi:hypothetical protein